MTLNYSQTGTSSARPLLFIHGLGASHQQTISALSLLENTRLIAPDMPGHGNSLSFDPEFFSFDYFADLIIDLLDKLEIEAIDLGGLSMGSGIALNIALRFPGRVKKLVILRPSWLDQIKPRHLSLVAKVGQWLDNTDEERATMNLALHSDYQDLVTTNIPVAESITALLDRRKDIASTRVLYKMWQSRPFEKVANLETIPHKTLVLDTTRDELHPQEIAAAIAKALPNSKTVTLPARYHEGKAYQKALNSELNQFLSK